MEGVTCGQIGRTSLQEPHERLTGDQPSVQQRFQSPSDAAIRKLREYQCDGLLLAGEAAAEPEAEEAEAEEPEPVQSGNGAGIQVASTET